MHASRFASQIRGSCLLNDVNLETLRQLSFWGIPAKLVTVACKIVLVNKIRNLDFHVNFVLLSPSGQYSSNSVVNLG